MRYFIAYKSGTKEPVAKVMCANEGFRGMMFSFVLDWFEVTEPEYNKIIL